MEATNETSIYITVRLDISSKKAMVWDDETCQDIVNELDYYFRLNTNKDIYIDDTEICGIND